MHEIRFDFPTQWIYGIRIKNSKGLIFSICSNYLCDIDSDDYTVDISKICRGILEIEQNRQRYLQAGDHTVHRPVPFGVTLSVEFLIMAANNYPQDSSILEVDKTELRFNALDGRRIDYCAVEGISSLEAEAEFITTN